MPATVYFLPEPLTAANQGNRGTQVGTHDFSKREKVVQIFYSEVQKGAWFEIIQIYLHFCI